MAIDISTISNLINEFRLIQVRDSVSPDNLGYLLDKIVSLIDGMPDSTDLETLRTQIDVAKSYIETCSVNASSAQQAASEASGALAALSALVAKPNGIATLDSSGKLLRSQRPDGMNESGGNVEIIRFGAYIDTTPECVDESFTGSQDDDNTIVVYDDGTERFMIGVCKHPVLDGNWKTPYFGSLPTGKSDTLADGATANARHLWYVNSAGFVCLNDEMFDFYSYWDGADKIGEAYSTNPCTPIPDKIYIATNGIFSTCGHALVVMVPSYQGMRNVARIENLESRVKLLEQSIVVQ